MFKIVKLLPNNYKKKKKGKKRDIKDKEKKVIKVFFRILIAYVREACQTLYDIIRKLNLKTKIKTMLKIC